jgi:hypothetical protein
MKTHFNLDNFHGRPNETVSTSNIAGSIKITMCINVSQSAWFCIAPDCSKQWNIKENFNTSAQVHKMLALHICDFWNEKC